MVFESLVADLLNKYLGQYVKNLDASQLNIGIWGGDVVLENLQLKDTALDELALPIKVVHGFLGKLTLKIPWKRLYSESTIVEIEDLHLVAKPNFDVKYNKEREEKGKFEEKQRKIENIDEARRLEQLKKDGKTDKESDSFAQKLATNVIKNLQVKIKNIHVRYEDSVSDPRSPFSVGITMENLSAETTNENFVPQLIKESVTMIHKLVRLDNLAVYWNSHETFKEMTTEEWLAVSKSLIATNDKKLSKMDYIIQPIVASKKVTINTKPGENLKIPQIFLSLVMEELGIVMHHGQYHGVIHLLELFERMGKNVPFRKYRPDVPLSAGNSAIWWKYCINSILIEDVRRRLQMWKWSNIQKHRHLCKLYQKKYKGKLSTKNPSTALLTELEAMENQLNIASITIFRSLAETEVLREKKQKGSFMSFFSSKKQKEKKASTKLEELMGEDKNEEMQKLYNAIGYSESEAVTPFPKEYVAMVFELELKRISLTVIDENEKMDRLDLLRFTLDEIAVGVKQRPSANALKVHVSIAKMKLHGAPTDEETPVMIRSLTTGTTEKTLPMVDFTFETNPLNKEHVDQFIYSVCQPLEIVYDANTINKLITFFEPPEDVLLQDLQEKAYSTFEEFKESSTAGLLYAMEQRSIVDVDIQVGASYLIIPERGALAQCKDMIIVDFGSFQLQSDPNQQRIINIKEIENVADVQDKAYDRYLLKMADLQILLCREGEDINKARVDQASTFNVLLPVAFDGKLAKAILPSDPRLKQVSVSGELTSLELAISDSKIARLFKLVESLPLPQKPVKPEEEMTEETHLKTRRMLSRQYSMDIHIPEGEEANFADDDEPPDELSILELQPRGEDPSFESGIANQVKIEINFKIKTLKLSVALTDKELKEEKHCLEVSIENIGSEVILRRWDMFVNANVGRFLLREMTYGFDGEPLDILSTPKDSDLFKISYRRCEFNQAMNLGNIAYFYSAEAQRLALHYKDEFGATEQIINIEVSMMYLVLHQEALLSIMSLVRQVLEPLNKTDTKKSEEFKKKISRAGSRISLALQEKSESMKSTGKQLSSRKKEVACEFKKKAGLENEAKVRVNATMAGFGVFICSSSVDLAQAFIKGLSAQVLLQDERIEIKASMKDVKLQDNVGTSKFSTIVSMQSDQVFDLEIAIFENGSSGDKTYDPMAVDTLIKLNIGQVRAVFLNRFIMDILSFVDHFEDAQKAILEAGKAAKDRAATAVTEYKKHISRHKLNVIIRAPLVIIPIHSNSDLALLVDLGELRVHNKFKILNREQGHKNVVITDNMSVKLTDLKLLKALIKDGTEISVQKELVKPVTLKIDVIRNLTPANHSVPDLDIGGSLHKITLVMSEEDVSVALGILKGNIAEGELHAPPKRKNVKQAKQSLDGLESHSDRLASIYEENETGSYVKLRFKFDLEQIVLQIYLKPADMTFEEEFLERDIDLLLSEFCIGHLDVDGSMMSDNGMKVTVSLDNLTLDDKRPVSRDNLTRMIDNCPESLISSDGGGEASQQAIAERMINVKFEQSSNLDKTINVDVTNLLCIANMEFIMVLIRTALAALPQDDKIRSDSLSSAGSPTHSIASSSDDDSDISEKEGGNMADITHPELKLFLSVKNPQIVLLADAKDDKTNALFLTTEVNFQYLEISNIQKMVGSITEMAMLSTAFKKHHRTDISTVLSLPSVSLHSSAPIGGKPHINVNTGLVKLNVSPKTIRTISACVGQTVPPPDEEATREHKKLMARLWHIVDISNKNFWYLNTPAQDILSAGSFVLSRTEDGTYRNGFLAKIDTHFTVYFYPEGVISHSISDVTSVVIDMTPKETDLMVGTNVIAKHGSDGLRVARIMEVWKNAGSVRSPEKKNLSADGWDTLNDTSDKYNKYLVRFYHSLTEKYVISEELRTVPHPIKGVIPGLGGGIYARYKDGFYYRGIVESLLGYKIRVYMEEIGDEIDHDMDDPSAVILNVTPRESQVKKFFKVIAQKSNDSKGFHPGKVTAIEGNAGHRSYSIKFEDGSTNQVPITKLLLMPKAAHDALPEIGAYVYSRVARDAPLFEKGIVADVDNKIYVKHLNGRKLAHDRKNIGFVIRNIVPMTKSLHVGQEVIAQVDTDDQKMYMGVIKEISRGKNTMKYLVQYTDGTSKRLTPGKIRIISMYGHSENPSLEDESTQARNEHLILEVDGISLRIEGYLGGKLEPMLRFDSKVFAEVRDWSTKLKASVTVSLSANYYNDTVAEWEPLIEPVIQENNERPWELQVEYITEDDNVQSGGSHSTDVAVLQKPMSTVTLQSNDNLEATLTHSSLSLLQDLGKVFGKAVESTEGITQNYVAEKVPYVIHNMIGKKLSITLGELLETKTKEKLLTLAESESVGLNHIYRDFRTTRKHLNKLPTISIQVQGYQLIQNISVKRQKTVIYDLIPVNILTSSSAFSVVVNVAATDGQRIITLRSPLQIQNHFPIPLDVLYVNNQSSLVKLTSIDSGAVYAVPLLPAYHSNFFLKPSGFGYNETKEALSWSELATIESKRKQLMCTNPSNEDDLFFIQVVAVEDVFTSVHGMIGAVPRYIMHCYPPIMLHNYLPYPISYMLKGMSGMETLEGGSHWPLYTINIDEKPVIELQLENYMGRKWIGSMAVTGCGAKNFKTTTLILQSDDERLDIGAFSQQEGSLSITLYSPYWMLNKTGKTLVYQAIGRNRLQEHGKDDEGAVMFHVKGKKKKARVCVSECEWSDEFSLDTIGSGGQVTSKGLRDRMYEIGVGISLSYFGLTKIVTFTPLRILSNQTEFDISMAEDDSGTSEWHNIKPGESVPYWPCQLPPKNLYLNINGNESSKFDLDAGKTLLLRIEQIGGVCVNFQEKDSSSLLSFSPYFSGSAPVRIENLCKKISMISYKQANYIKGHILTYGQSVLYTWDDPTIEQELVCGIIEVDDSQTTIKLDQNDFGRMKAGENAAIYWVSFLDGLQRVLLFTDNFKSAYCASQEQMLRPTQEINVNIEGLGLSLVNIEKRMEVAYLSIRKSPIVWEQQKRKRWKTLPGALCEALEEGYQKGQTRKSTSDWKEKILDMEVDYEKMFITKPEKIPIRRTFHSGIGFQYIISPNQMQISATISSLQFDSHIPGSAFLTILQQVQPPKSITNDSAPKPFFELSLITKVGEKNVVNEISYLKVLIQEMDVRIDKGFILSTMDLFDNEKLRGTESERYRYDMSLVDQKLEESPEFQGAKQDKRYVFDDFHLSPLKVHVSFSMTGGHAIDGDDNAMMQNNVLNLLFQSVGVAFTEIQDVEFKLACFEVKSVLLSNSQLTDNIAKHYQNQAVKQLYVLVLGLDVLGNPYGLISGVGKGAKNFFYEPYQGLIQGPEEFAEGLAYGVKSLVGGTVGGVSGAVSKITGTVGKGLAALTLDDEYQQKRRQAMSQKPQNLGQGLAKGGKGLLKGILSGVTGIVTKPVEGAKAEGAGGFFKGVGKGLIGVVARPAGGVVDMASSTFEGLKNTTSGVKSVHRIRVARVFHADKVLRPFNEYEADGNNVLMEADKGKFAKTDYYFVHVYPVDGKNYLILTNKNVIYVTRKEIMHEWESVWSMSFENMKGAPEVAGSRIAFHEHGTGESKSFFKRNSSSRTVDLHAEATATWFLTKLKDAKML